MHLLPNPKLSGLLGLVLGYCAELNNDRKTRDSFTISTGMLNAVVEHLRALADQIERTGEIPNVVQSGQVFRVIK